MATSAVSTGKQLEQDKQAFTELDLLLKRTADYISNRAPAPYIKRLQEQLSQLSNGTSLAKYVESLPAETREKFTLFQQRVLSLPAAISPANEETPTPPPASSASASGGGYLAAAYNAVTGVFTGGRVSSPEKSPASSSPSSEPKKEDKKTELPDWAKDENYNTDKVKEKNKFEEEQRKAKELEAKQAAEKEKETETPTPDVSSSTSAIETNKTKEPDWAKDENYNTDKVKEENARIEAARKEAEALLLKQKEEKENQLVAQWSAGLPYVSAQTAALMKRDAANGCSRPSDETQRSKAYDFDG